MHDLLLIFSSSSLLDLLLKEFESMLGVSIDEVCFCHAVDVGKAITVILEDSFAQQSVVMVVS